METELKLLFLELSAQHCRKKSFCLKLCKIKNTLVEFNTRDFKDFQEMGVPYACSLLAYGTNFATCKIALEQELFCPLCHQL